MQSGRIILSAVVTLTLQNGFISIKIYLYWQPFVSLTSSHGKDDVDKIDDLDTVTDGRE